MLRRDMLIRVYDAGAVVGGVVAAVVVLALFAALTYRYTRKRVKRIVVGKPGATIPLTKGQKVAAALARGRQRQADKKKLPRERSAEMMMPQAMRTAAAAQRAAQEAAARRKNVRPVDFTLNTLMYSLVAARRVRWAFGRPWRQPLCQLAPSSVAPASVPAPVRSPRAACSQTTITTMTTTVRRRRCPAASARAPPTGGATAAAASRASAP